MPSNKSTPKRGQFSGGNSRSVPLDIETAKNLGGGARGRTLALIYRQLNYWMKFAKWKGSNNKRFFYKSQKELAEELCMSEKTINRGIKALRELGMIIVEKLHKRYWRQVNFYHLPHSVTSKEAAAAAGASTTAPAAPTRPHSTSSNRSRSNQAAGGSTGAAGAVVDAPAAAAATARSIRARSTRGFGKNVRIQQRDDNPSIKQSLQEIVERCNQLGNNNQKQDDAMLTTA